jgi:hypothetical protein
MRRERISGLAVCDDSRSARGRTSICTPPVSPTFAARDLGGAFDSRRLEEPRRESNLRVSPAGVLRSFPACTSAAYTAASAGARGSWVPADGSYDTHTDTNTPDKTTTIQTHLWRARGVGEVICGRSGAAADALDHAEPAPRHHQTP